ncbi:MAG: hypothetical protein HY975_04395 [Candidatus Kerfeldbacteria bacterium]|nr:hypothetical protein [Candidatus Kerfeldbacteria bacterium]
MRKLWRHRYTCLCVGLGVIWAITDTTMTVRHTLPDNYWPFFMPPVIGLFGAATLWIENRS